jgi:hypothetical protein
MLTRISLAGSLLFALGAQLTLNYHVTALAYLVAFVVAKRDSGRLSGRLIAPLILSMCILGYHWLYLLHSGVASPRLIVGALMGRPSVWAYFNFAKLSYVAAGVTGLGLAHAIVAISCRRPISDFWLLFVLGVWIPLLVIGLFQWYPAPRYTIGCFLPLLVCAFATAQQALAAIASAPDRRPYAMQTGAALMLIVLAVNPVALAKAVDSGYDIHPDHKGAAQFIQSRHLHADDRVLAEDVLMQTYYLKRVDYWLIARPVATPFVEKVNGEYVDGYTHTRVIGSGAELQRLVDWHDRGALYVITSAEDGGGEDRYLEGEGIYDVLRNGSFKKVFVGRDGRTFVWMSEPRRELGAAGVGAR